ncbi:unnamed protein product [Aphis gossypii]|uniref:Uncharacterized protein n=1 Tax=Aphis gossypii TaxID=80765 RepID=A0A9P0NGF9_APHGO|nr:unnamed protein product [Aphis gossypii]
MHVYIILYHIIYRYIYIERDIRYLNRYSVYDNIYIICNIVRCVRRDIWTSRNRIPALSLILRRPCATRRRRPRNNNNTLATAPRRRTTPPNNIILLSSSSLSSSPSPSSSSSLLLLLSSHRFDNDGCLSRTIPSVLVLSVYNYCVMYSI